MSSGTGLASEISEILEAYTESPEYRTAVETWQLEVTRAGISLDNTSKVGFEAALDLVHNITRQIVLVGFAVIVDGRVVPEANINWNEEESEWTTSANGEAFICMFMQPVLIAGTWRLGSYGSAALSIWHQLSGMMSNLAARDTFNSIPSVYTTVNPNMTPGDSIAPSFIAARGNQANAASIEADHTTVARRHDLLGELMEQSQKIRQFSRIPLVAGGGFEQEAPKQHMEFFVTDGQVSAGEGRHLNGPVSDFNRLMRTLRQSLFQSLGVPPQILGENVNSERLAGSTQITTQAIRIHNVRLVDMRARINGTLDEMGIVVRPFASESDIIRFRHAFKPEVHRALLAASIGIPEEFLIDDTTMIDVDSTNTE